MQDRYYVATTFGYLDPGAGGKRNRPHVSAMVLDRDDLHREVALYRSEYAYGGRHERSVKRAIERAERHAAMLNAGEPVNRADVMGWKHGTQHAYQEGRCKCPECRSWKAGQSRARTARRLARERVSS